MWNRFLIFFWCLIAVEALSQNQEIALALQTGHSYEIEKVYFSPDAKYLASKDVNDVIKVWYMPTGNELTTVDSFESLRIFNISVDSTDGLKSESGKYRVSYTDQQVVLKDRNGHKVLNFTTDYIDEVFTSVAVSEKHDLVLAGNTDGKIYVGRPSTGKVLKSLKHHLAGVNHVIFDPKFDQFVSASNDRSILIWDANTLSPIKKLATRSFKITAMCVSDNAQRIAFGDEYGNVKLIDLADSRFEIIQKTFGYGAVLDIEFANNDQDLAVAFEKNKFSLINATDLELRKKKTFRSNFYRNVKSNLRNGSTYGIHSLPTTVTQLNRDPNGEYLIVNGVSNFYKEKTEGIYDRDGLDILQLPKMHRKSRFQQSKLENNPLMIQYMQWVTNARVVIPYQNDQLLVTSIEGENVQLKNIQFTSQDIIYLTENGILKAAVADIAIPLSEPHHFSKEVKMNAQKTLIGIVEDNNIKIHSIANSSIETLNGHEDIVTSIDFLNGQNILVSSSLDGTMKLWDLDNMTLKMTIVPIDFDKVVLLTPNNYYYSPKNTLNSLGFKSGKLFLPVSQFDLTYNRPDVILESLGYSETKVIALYRNAYRKRIKKMNISSISDLDKSDASEIVFHLPEIEVLNDIPPQSSEKILNLKINARDSLYDLNSINISINGVPLYGSAGLQVSSEKTAHLDTMVELSAGSNTIEISCYNEKGIESFKQQVHTQYQAGNIKGNMYFIALSVSDYQDNTYDLSYARKDGADLINLLNSKEESYDSLFIDSLFDQNATKEKFLLIKEKLLKSKVDDQVIVFISGHGLLDDNFDFYFATHDCDFQDPANRGVAYDQIENLLDAIPARRKLLLMDACHSGEVDKDELIALQEERVGDKKEERKKGINKYIYRGATTVAANTENQLGLTNSFQLMQELFANLSRGSGAVVISAAAGDSYALESSKWRNGVFTYALLSGLKNRSADLNKNKEITVSELMEYVSNKVVLETEGKQKPTSRQENLAFDFMIWK
jgi:WD40 repeat protein